MADQSSIIQFKKISGDSIQSITQFNCQVIIYTSPTRKVPENCMKCVQNRPKSFFFSKLKISIQHTNHFYLFFLNSIQKIIEYYFFQEYSIQNIIQLVFFPGKFNSKSDSNFEFGCIQFNKIFIQLENPFIAHPSADGTNVAAIVIYG